MLTFRLTEHKSGFSLALIEPAYREAGDLGDAEASRLRTNARAMAEQDVIADKLDGGVAIDALRIVLDNALVDPRLPFILGNRGVEGRTLSGGDAGSIGFVVVVPHNEQIACRRDSLDARGRER